VLNATHKAKRAIEHYLIARKPEVEAWPRSRKEAELERLRKRFEKDEKYQDLVNEAKAAQAKLEAAYPQVFVSDEEIRTMKKSASEKVKNDPAYKAAKSERSEAYRAQQEYLLKNDEQLTEAAKKLEQQGN